MKALTLRHPWPWAICRCGKNVENRTWVPAMRIGERFAIHGGRFPRVVNGKASTSADAEYLQNIVFETKSICDSFGVVGPVTLSMLSRYCGIVALVTFGGVTRDPEDSPWHGGHLAWWLNDVEVLPEPIPIKGAQGLWTVPNGILP